MWLLNMFRKYASLGLWVMVGGRFWSLSNIGLVMIITKKAPNELPFQMTLVIGIKGKKSSYKVYFMASLVLFIPCSRQNTAYPRDPLQLVAIYDNVRITAVEIFTFCVKWVCRRNTTCHQHKHPAINKNKLKTVSHH